jgi:hypothetical protein
VKFPSSFSQSVDAGGGQTHRQRGDLISLHPFLESRLIMLTLKYYIVVCKPQMVPLFYLTALKNMFEI